MTIVEFLRQHGVDHREGGTHSHVRPGWIGVDVKTLLGEVWLSVIMDGRANRPNSKQTTPFRHRHSLVGLLWCRLGLSWEKTDGMRLHGPEQGQRQVLRRED